MSDASSSLTKEVDAALEGWRQGDFVLGDFDFLYLADLKRPLTQAAKELVQEGSPGGGPVGDPVATSVVGLIVLSHTCDLVRSCKDRPYVEVAPLVPVEQSKFGHVRAGRTTGLVYVPALVDKCIAADIERTMTVEKAILLGWDRQRGLRNDEESRNFSRALARKRDRFPFPDDFVALARKFAERVAKVHDKDSDEGKMLRLLRYIRVRAAPSWYDKEVHLTLIFVKERGSEAIPGEAWAKQTEEWRRLFKPSGRYKVLEAIAGTTDELLASDIEESDPIDFEHLSRSA